MNEALYEAWIHALETTTAKQGIGGLKDHNGAMCCLGVACDVASTLDSERYGMWLDKPDEGYVVFRDGDNYPHGCSTAALSRTIQEDLNFATSSGRVSLDELPEELRQKYYYNNPYATVNHHVTTSLAHMNDGRDFTFHDIAQVLRARPKSLFREEPSCRST